VGDLPESVAFELKYNIHKGGKSLEIDMVW